MNQNFYKWKILSLKLMNRIKRQLGTIEERISDQKLGLEKDHSEARIDKEMKIIKVNLENEE